MTDRDQIPELTKALGEIFAQAGKFLVAESIVVIKEI